MHGNEYLIQKVKRIACAFIAISLFYTIIDSDERFVMSSLPDTRLSTGPRALLQQDLVNLLGIAARCPYVYLLVVEKITCAVER